jgi:hypothetical protein
MNAIKHQMTGQYLFMPAKELAEYLDLGHQLIEELRPVGMLEAQFAQRIVDATWRLNRSGSLDCIAVNTRVAIASRRVIAANPGGSEESHLVNSQALAANKECVDLIEKLGRYSSRTQRDMEKTIAALNAMKSSRIHKRGDQYSVETCPVYAWYRKLSNLTDRLVEAREEVREKSVEEVTPKPAPAEAAKRLRTNHISRTFDSQNDPPAGHSSDPGDGGNHPPGGLLRPLARRRAQLAPAEGRRIADLVLFIRVYRRESAAQYLSDRLVEAPVSTESLIHQTTRRLGTPLTPETA